MNFSAYFGSSQTGLWLTLLVSMTIQDTVPSCHDHVAIVASHYEWSYVTHSLLDTIEKTHSTCSLTAVAVLCTEKWH